VQVTGDVQSNQSGHRAEEGNMEIVSDYKGVKGITIKV